MKLLHITVRGNILYETIVIWHKTVISDSYHITGCGWDFLCSSCEIKCVSLLYVIEDEKRWRDSITKFEMSSKLTLLFLL